MSKLAGKIALITGGSSGIGLAAAKSFVAEGAYVFIAGLNQGALDMAKAEIGRNVSAIQADITNLADIDRLYRAVRQEKGALDILVVSAGIIEQMTTDMATPEHFDRIFGLNARGAYFTVQKALPLLSDGGAIVLVSSAIRLKGIPGHGVYGGAKAALRAFARTWAVELKDRGIRVNTVSPGPIDTPMLNNQCETPEETAAMKAAYAQMIPLNRVGTAGEIAKAILFLASDDSSFSTGIDLVADGGATQV